MKDTQKSKSDPNLTETHPKDNERYCDNSYTSNGYSFITNKNLLNTSMSPIHKVTSKHTIMRDEKVQHSRKVFLVDLNM